MTRLLLIIALLWAIAATVSAVATAWRYDQDRLMWQTVHRERVDR